MKKASLIFILSIIAIITNCSAKELKLETLYGSVEIKEDVLIDLIESPPFQRLKNLRQYGIVSAVIPTTPHSRPYSRYEHSLGVMVLLIKKERPLKEQIAGLLHDASHTAFSHLADKIFNVSGHDSYQDTIHCWYLKECGFESILKKYGYEVEAVYHKSGNFPCVAASLPGLNADRIDYNLQGALLAELISQEEFNLIVEDLKYDENGWSMSRVDLAEKLGVSCIQMMQGIWTGKESYFADKLLACAVKKAIALELMTLDDFLFKDDDFVWGFLKESDDEEIVDLVYQIEHLHDLLSEDEKSNSIEHLITYKCRALDPLMRVEDDLKHLSEVSISYKNYIFQATKMANRGKKVYFNKQNLRNQIAKS